MFLSHRLDVKRWLKRGSNELLIRFRSAMDYLRKARKDFSPPCEFNDPIPVGDGVSETVTFRDNLPSPVGTPRQISV
jgi:hypothetical protein